MQPLGPLHGLPVAHKDSLETAGLRTTYGSALFADNVPTTDQLIAERIEAAGAITIGKTNVPELGLGSHTVKFTADGLPIGLQVIGPYRREAKLLGFARAVELATGFGQSRPRVNIDQRTCLA